MQRKPINVFLISVLVIVCLSACYLFTLLPIGALDTGLVYKGF